MYIGVVSDTHGRVESSRRAAELLTTCGKPLEAVFHCGDIGSPAVPPIFSAWKTHYVFGNVDDDEVALWEAVDAAGGACHGRFGEIEMEHVRIALLHGDDEPRLREAISGQKYDLILHGHTHRADHRYVDRTLVFNPGAVHRANPPSIAVVQLPELVFERLVLR